MAYRGGGGYGGFGGMLTPWVKRLLIANFVVFFLTSFGSFGRLAVYFALDTSNFLLRPWTLITYMFLHGGFWHIAGNMLGLFFFGPPLESRWGSDTFIRFYLACGLGGGALFILTALMSGPALVIGASGAIIGVLVAFALYWPDATILLYFAIPIKVKYYVGFLIAFDLWLAIESSPGDPVAHFAHLGGAAVAVLFVKWWQPRHLNEWKAKAKPGGSESPMAGLRRRLGGSRKRHVTIVGSDQPGAGRGAPPRSGRRDEERMLDEVDQVLDKISKSGIASLTPQERKLLDDVSRRYRSN